MAEIDFLGLVLLEPVSVGTSLPNDMSLDLCIRGEIFMIITNNVLMSFFVLFGRVLSFQRPL